MEGPSGRTGSRSEGGRGDRKLRAGGFVIAQFRLPEGLPGSEEEWLYLAICAAFFTFCGLACGYFVWRKGHMQTMDAEMEVLRTENELRSLREDLTEEERQIRSGEASELIESVLSDNREKQETEEKPRENSGVS